ncbi:MAG: copper resistance protein B [Vicinamibacterales bacterium]
MGVVLFALASMVGVGPGSTAWAQAPSTTEPQETALPPFIPALTEEDRKAAFPDVDGHAMSGNRVNYFALFDQLEWQRANGVNHLNLDARGWVGRDSNRVWFRAEGDGDRHGVGDAQAHALYGRQVSRWWDLVAGIRQDFSPGAAQAWAAVGVQGLAPYWFDVEATAYVGASGRTHARVEVEYEVLVTNRLVVQPLFEMELYGRTDAQRAVGAGLSTTDAGLRLRYEFRRELAPYVGMTWNRKWGKTADFARAAGEDTAGARVVSGVRLWF